MPKTDLLADPERCSICGCQLHRNGEYGKPTVKGRSHAGRHHFVAERFFGRSANRPGEVREPVFEDCPWGLEGEAATFCYECHEELLHNPVFTPKDLRVFAKLVKRRGFEEDHKSKDRSRLAGRIKLLHEVIENGLEVLDHRSSGFSE